MRNMNTWIASIGMAALLALGVLIPAQESDSKGKEQEAQAKAQEAKAKEKAARLKSEMDAKVKELEAKAQELQAQAKEMEEQAKENDARRKAEQERTAQTLMQLQAAANPGSFSTAVIPVQYADVKNIADVLRTFKDVLGGKVVPNPDLRVIAVSGSKELVAACEEAVKKLDVPPKSARNLNLTFYLLVAVRQGGGSGEVPADLQKVCDQLREATGFKSFQLVDTMMLRTKEGARADQMGALRAAAAGGSDRPYRLGFDEASVTQSDRGARIHLAKLFLHADVELTKGSATTTSSAGINTDIEFGEGQKAVVGMTGGGGKDGALVLVVTGKIAE